MENKISKYPNYPTGAKYKVFQAAVLSLSLLLAAVSVAGCLLGDLAKEFPDAPQWYLMMFTTFPTVGGMIANIIGGAMATKVGKKNLCLIGIMMAFLGGFLPMFMPTLELKIAVRVIAGLGVGLIQPLSASLIVDCFEGDTANVMMGFQSACVGLGASIFSYTMAAIMVYDWHYAYCAYLYAIAIFILVLVGIPSFVNDIGREEKKEKKTASNVARHALPVAAYVGCIAQFIYGLGYGAFDNCLSVAATETATISTVSAAAIASWGGIASLVGGLVFGVAVKFTGLKKMGIISLVLNVIGFLIVGLTDTTIMWYIGVTILKIGFCWWMPFVNFLVNDGTDETNSALATSLGFVGNSLGSFVFGYVFSLIGNLFGGFSYHQGFVYGSVFIGIALVLVAWYVLTHKDEKMEA